MTGDTRSVQLRVRHPDGQQALHQLVLNQSLWIGRDASCDLVLNSPNVSRRHARVFEQGDVLCIEDHSANGTLVDETPLSKRRHALSTAHVVRIGPFELHILERSGGATRGEEQDASNLATPASSRPPSQIREEALHDKALHEQALHEETVPVPARLRRRVHRALLEHLDLAHVDRAKMEPARLRPLVVEALQHIIATLEHELPQGVDTKRLVTELCDEALGLGPLEQLLAAADVSEIMVVDPETIFVERNGRIELTGLRFIDEASVRAVIERIVTPLGRRIDESTPLVDARLQDGSRVNAIIPPLAVKGPCITIRKFAHDPLGLDDLIALGSIDARMARFLLRCVKARKNIVISGGTGSGKTTLLNVLSSAIPVQERVVTIEDAAELRLSQPHVVSLESRPANMEGKGAYSIRDLVRNALRMRPDRIVVGECRGGEALDMLQAMNTGHEGSMTTTHANSPKEAVGRLETLCLMADLDLPIRAIRGQIAASVHLVVQQTRFFDGSRRIVSISEVVGIDDRDEVELRELLSFRQEGMDASGGVVGNFGASGYMPTFAEQLITKGLVDDGELL